MSSMRRLAALVAYHGGALHGFQRQPGFPTAQEELERAWTAVTGERVVIHGSGRTDAGVHAWGQVVHWNTQARLPLPKVRPALNAYLPEEMAVRAANEVGPEFHARQSAIGKRYLYLMATGPVRPVLRREAVGWERGYPDLAAMRAAARLLCGRHDFAAFAAAGRTTKTTVRTLRSVHLFPIQGGLGLLFEGDGFLYKMVRNLVGTLLEVGRRRRGPEWVATVLESGDRRRAGPCAAPQGLYLWRVRYARDPFPDLVPGSARLKGYMLDPGNASRFTTGAPHPASSLNRP